MTITNTLARSASCTKCVEVLKELISGLQEDNDNHNNKNIDHKNKNSNSNSSSSVSELPPLTLLKAIARSSYQQRHEYDQWGQPKATASSLSSRHHRRRHRRHSDHDHDHVYNQNHDTDTDTELSQSSSPQSLLKIEEFEDGVRLIIPAVETTAPTLMKRWTQLQQPIPSTTTTATATATATTNHYQMKEQEEQEIVKIRDRVDVVDNVDSVTVTTIPPTLATSATSSSISSSQRTTVIDNPFKVELYCRKCSTTGPEAGARAFLMGPNPLSIVLCHNRISSTPKEIEEIITHELIHLYDVQTLHLDLRDCETVAYSEIRAAREAECSRYKPFYTQPPPPAASSSRGGEVTDDDNYDDDGDKSSSSSPSLSQLQNAVHIVPSYLSTTIKESWSKAQHTYCIKNTALGAIQNMFPQPRGKGKQCLNKVWENAYNDHRPFHQQQHQHSYRRPSSSGHPRTSGQRRQQQQQQDYSSEEENSNTSRCTSTSSSGTSHGTSDK